MEENPGPAIFDIVDPTRTVSADYSQGDEVFGENAASKNWLMKRVVIQYQQTPWRHHLQTTCVHNNNSVSQFSSDEE